MQGRIEPVSEMMRLGQFTQRIQSSSVRLVHYNHLPNSSEHDVICEREIKYARKIMGNDVKQNLRSLTVSNSEELHISQ